jgi:uncharacterized membrane protein
MDASPSLAEAPVPSPPRAAAVGPGWPTLAAVVAISVLGAALRLYRPTFQSLWFDELFSVVFSDPGRPLGDVVRTYRTDFHPLLYPLFLHVWLGLFGATELAARLSTVVAGIAAIPAMFVLGRRLAGREVGLVAALVTAVNPFHLAYSQEVRNYGLLFLLAAASYAALLALYVRPRALSLAAYVLFAGLALHTHYYAVILVGGQLAGASALAMVRQRSWRATLPFAAAGGSLALVLAPWAGPLLRAAGVAEYWPAKPGPWFAVEYLHLYFGQQLWLTILVGLLLASLVIPARDDAQVSLAVAARQRDLARLLAVAAALSLLVPYLWSLVRVPILLPRCTLIVLPVLFVLVALAIRRLPGRWLRHAVAVAVAAGSLHTLLVTQRYYQTVRNEQWRETARWAVEHAESADRFVSELAPGFQFYFAQDGVGRRVEALTPDVLRAAARDGAAVWVLVARDRAGAAAVRELLGRRFELVAEKPFFSARAERWRPR